MIQLTGYNVHLCEETVSPSSRRDKDDRVLESIDIPAKFKSIPNDRYISKIYREGVYRFIPRYVITSFDAIVAGIFLVFDEKSMVQIISHLIPFIYIPCMFNWRVNKEQRYRIWRLVS